MEYYEQIYANKFEDLYEMEKFLPYKTQPSQRLLKKK